MHFFEKFKPSTGQVRIFRPSPVVPTTEFPHNSTTDLHIVSSPAPLGSGRPTSTHRAPSNLEKIKEKYEYEYI